MTYNGGPGVASLQIDSNDSDSPQVILPLNAVDFGSLPRGPGSISGNVLWLDAADTASITATDGLVDTWADKSSAGSGDVTQTGNLRPVSGSANLNGINVLSFDGDFLAGPAVLPAGDDDYTMFAVWVPNRNGVMSVWEQSGPDDGSRAAILAVNAAYGFNGERNDDHDIVPYAPGVARLTAIRVDNALTVDGVNNIFLNDNGFDYLGLTNDPASLAVGTNGMRVGAKVLNNAETFFGEIGEIIVFDRLLSDGTEDESDNETNDVLFYLDQKWRLGNGITATPSRIPFAITKVVKNPNNTVTLTFNSNPTPGTRYSVYFSSDLSGGDDPKANWGEDTDNTPTQGETTEYTTVNAFTQERIFFVVIEED